MPRPPSSRLIAMFWALCGMGAANFAAAVWVFLTMPPPSPLARQSYVVSGRVVCHEDGSQETRYYCGAATEAIERATQHQAGAGLCRSLLHLSSRCACLPIGATSPVSSVSALPFSR